MNLLDDIERIETELNNAMLAVDNALGQIGTLKAYTLKALAEMGELPPTNTPQESTPGVEEAPAAIEPLVINQEWQAVLDLLNHGREHVFVTGEAGTGKSTLLNYFVEHYGGVAAILAPTGVAALRVGGQTIHRFFGFGAHALDADDIREVSDSRQQKYKAVDLLIIDEISMVRADMMDAVDEFLRKNGRTRNKPFGGCRLIMFGDLYQLPPVSKEKDERKWLMQRYGTETPYFFHAKVWEQAPLKTCQLTTIFRQKDPIFTGALNAIRRGNITQEHLQLINSRVDERFRPSATDELWLTLTTTNASAEQLNQRMLSAINAPSEVFTADVVGDFDLKNAPTDEHLELKPGAIVMFVRNDPDGKWVNGTLGKVTSVNPLQVLVKGLEVEVEPVTWESISYDYDEQARKLFKAIRGKFIQVPLKLASAITVHKGQGLTFDQVIVDFASGAFAAGQAYVALSRCRTLQGMVLRRPVRERDLIVSDEVRKFMSGEPVARGAGQLQMFGAGA